MIRPLLPVKSREEYAQDAARQARGVTLAAIFDWALGCLLVLFPARLITLYGITAQQTLAAVVLAIICVPCLLLLIESLRRASELARVIQINVSSLILVASVAGVLVDLRDLLRGEINLSMNLPSLLAGIFIVYGLTRRQTIVWFAEVSPAEAFRHHDRRWLLRVALIGTAIGVLAVFINIG